MISDWLPNQKCSLPRGVLYMNTSLTVKRERKFENHIENRRIRKEVFPSYLNFCDEAWWFLSLRVFRLLSLSLLFPQCFGQCPRAFFRCLSNSGTYKELWTTSFIESTGITCSDSVSHNRVQVLSIPVLLLTCWTYSVTVIGIGSLRF